jgi:hypothetical protein
MRSIAILVVALASLAAPASAQRGGDWFGPADADRDGVVTRDEFMQYRDANFARLDRNGDGVVSPADFPRLASFKPNAFARLTDALGGADHNGDGAISRAELAQASPVIFDRADADRDHRVTKAEYDAARARLRTTIQQKRN